MTMAIDLSVAIITKDEEERLPDCLKSVSFADDIVVVDSGSTDRTVEIARKFGCRVFVEEWKGDGPQKNSAIDKCLHDWVLVIDADEQVPETTRERIIEIVAANEKADAFSFPRRNFLHGRWIRHCGWWPDRVIRLVRKSRGRYQSITHGRWATNGVEAGIEEPIDHYSFDGYSDMFYIMETRSTDMARELYEAGGRANVMTPFLHGLAMFLKTYVLKLGFLSGFDGMIISLTRAGGSFLKYVKLLDLQRGEKQKS